MIGRSVNTAFSLVDLLLYIYSLLISFEGFINVGIFATKERSRHYVSHIKKIAF